MSARWKTCGQASPTRCEAALHVHAHARAHSSVLQLDADQRCRSRWAPRRLVWSGRAASQSPRRLQQRCSSCQPTRGRCCRRGQVTAAAPWHPPACACACAVLHPVHCTAASYAPPLMLPLPWLPRVARPDVKWRFMWRVGPRPGSTTFPELNAAPVVPQVRACGSRVATGLTAAALLAACTCARARCSGSCWRQCPSRDTPCLTPARASLQGLPQWASVCDAWGAQLLDAVSTVAAMAAAGFGLAPDAIVSLMRNGPHLLAPTGSDLGRHGQLGTVLAGTAGRRGVQAAPHHAHPLLLPLLLVPPPPPPHTHTRLPRRPQPHHHPWAQQVPWPGGLDGRRVRRKVARRQPCGHASSDAA